MGMPATIAGKGEMNMHRFSTYSDKGPRENLEDVSCLLMTETSALPDGRVPILIIGDGVGGHEGGEIASSLALHAIAGHVSSFFSGIGTACSASQISSDLVLETLSQALQRGNSIVRQYSEEDAHLRRMATTAVCAAVCENILHVAWVGDSRCYVHGKNGLRQVTSDHTEVEQLIQAGLLDREQAKHLPQSHTINRFIGQRSNFRPETASVRVDRHDIILLCTDGLTDAVSDTGIASIIEAYRAGAFAFEDLSRRLVDEALANGTSDNTTVCCCEYAGLTTTSLFNGRTVTAAYPAAMAERIRELQKEIFSCVT